MVTGRVSQMSSVSDPIIQPISPAKRQYDKVCCTTTSQGAKCDLIVIEYKAANKLTAYIVEMGLLEMVIETIKERTKFSTEKSKRKEEMAKEAIAVVVTQTFDYMVNQGLFYGYINEGSSFIFLFINPDTPKTLYYEKVILGAASTTSSEGSKEQLRLTAVELVAGFVQMALSREPWNETERSKVRKKLRIWAPNDPSASPTPSPDRSNNDPDSPQFEELNKKNFP